MDDEIQPSRMIERLTSFLNSSLLSEERIVIPRENIIEVARLAILQLLLVSDDADGMRRRVDDSMMVEILVDSCDCEETKCGYCCGTEAIEMMPLDPKVMQKISRTVPSRVQEL